MNFDKLFSWIIVAVIAAALTGHLQDLQLWIWRTQAKVIYQNRTSTWGSPDFLKN